MIEFFPVKYYEYVHANGAHPNSWEAFVRWFQQNDIHLGWTEEDLSATFRLPGESTDGRLIIIDPRYVDLQEYVDWRMAAAKSPQYKPDDSQLQSKRSAN
jgi:hypothetical protein